jgi:hypothetical protein
MLCDDRCTTHRGANRPGGDCKCRIRADYSLQGGHVFHRETPRNPSKKASESILLWRTKQDEWLSIRFLRFTNFASGCRHKTTVKCTCSPRRFSVKRKWAGRSMGVSEFKSASQSRVAPGSVIFNRSVASGQSSLVSVSDRVEKLPQSSRSVASRRVASECACQLRTYPPMATAPGRPITPKSVISTALLKARRVARVELFTSIASRLAALKVPAAVQLRPVALRQRSRLLS